MQIELRSQGSGLCEFTDRYVRKVLLRLGMVHSEITRIHASFVPADENSLGRCHLLLVLDDGTELVGDAQARTIPESLERAIEQVWVLLLGERCRAQVQRVSARSFVS